MMMHRRFLRRRRPHLRRYFPMPAVSAQPDMTRQADGLLPMRALTLIYHEDFEPEISGIIQQKMLVARYTKVRDVIGARTDIMQEVDYAPNGRNHMIIIVATHDVVQALAQSFRHLREVKGHGLRGYITPVEGLI